MATVEKLENNRAKLTVTIDAETFEKGLNQAYLKTRNQYNIPGFRKGKVPRKVIENMFGEVVFYEEAFNNLWADAYDAALTENDLVAVDQPSLDLVSANKEEGVVFTAEVQLYPEVKLGQYKGIEVEEPEYTVTDADVEAQLAAEQDKNARFVDVDRAVENDDRVILDYSGSVDGVKFDGGTAEDQTLVIGSGTFIPGFEEQMVGMKAGEEKDITVTFPAEYHAEDLAGKEAVFHVAVKQIQVKEVPALDDEFAKDISAFDTLDELKADLKEKLTEAALENRRVIIENEALKAAARNAEVEIPECMIDRQASYMVQDIAYRLAMSGMKMEDYLKYTGTTVEQMKASFHDEAKDRVLLQIVISAVSKAEGLTCSEEELAAAAAEYAEQNGLVEAEFVKGLTEDDKEFLKERTVNRKAVKLIAESVTLKPAEKKEEAKPAKKTTRKKAAEKAEAAEAPAEGEEKPKKKTTRKKAAEKTEEAAE